MTRVTNPNGVLQNAIYHFRSGDSAAARQGRVHVLTPNTTFRRRDGETRQTLLEGLEAFDDWGTHMFLCHEEVGIVGSQPGCELTFERMATLAESELAEREASFHTSQHLTATSILLAQDFLQAQGSLVEAVGLYGSLGRSDVWPGDYDIILFVSQENAQAFLRYRQEQSRQGRPRRSPDDGKCMPSVLVERAEFPDHLANFLNLDPSTIERVAWRLRGNITKKEVAQSEGAHNLMAGSRVKKLDLQILPKRIDTAFRDTYHRVARDPDFLSRIHPDIQVFDPEKTIYTKERALALVSWEL